MTINIPGEVSPSLLPAPLEAGSVLAHETSGVHSKRGFQTHWVGARSTWKERGMGGEEGECGYSYPTFERELNGAGPAQAQYPDRSLLLYNVCCGYCKCTERTWSLWHKGNRVHGSARVGGRDARRWGPLYQQHRWAGRRDPILLLPASAGHVTTLGKGRPWARQLARTSVSLLEGMEGKGLCSQPLLSPGPLSSPHTEHCGCKTKRHKTFHNLHMVGR